MVRRLKIKFVDFWSDFNFEDNFIINILREKYICELSDNPDYLFFSTFGNRHLHYKCVKIMYIGENVFPDFNICDYAMAFDWLDFGDRYMRLPIYLIRDNFKDFRINYDIDCEAVLNRKFCSIVVSNIKHANPMRELFFKKLSTYKKVDSGGRVWNNVGGPVTDKHQFISQYKFNIAFENSSSLGYTTEKIMDAMIAQCIPVYWGDPLVHKNFNPEAFINVDNYRDVDEAVDYIVELDKNNELYLDMLRKPKVINKKMFDWEKEVYVFLTNIIDKPIDKAKYITDYGMQKLYRRNLMYADFVGNRLKINKIYSAFQTLKQNLGWF